MTEAEKRTRRAMTLREARSGWATVQVPDLAALLSGLAACGSADEAQRVEKPQHDPATVPAKEE